MDEFFERGWVRFPFDPDIAAWAAHADHAARAAEAAPAPGMLRCDGTWFVGVNALETAGEGRLPGGPPLTGAAVEVAKALIGAPFAFDKAQASVCYAGYPRRGEEEGEAAFRFRRDRDAAHVDGLLPVGPDRRRMLKETHGFVLGLPLNAAPAGGAPLIVWERSHLVMAEALGSALTGAPADRWADIDLTEPYQAARRRCFETLERVEIAAAQGEAYLVHRHALHGVAPWRAGGGEGRRAIAYFRPDPYPGAAPSWWLDDR
ncbi:MAG: hypothetical protein AAF360_00640 [Pseudomonadota bacterium]